MNLYAAEKTESGSSLSETDRAILDSYAKLLPAFSAVLGGCCLVVLRSAAEKTYPCIAVENGVINQTNIGDPAPILSLTPSATKIGLASGILSAHILPKVRTSTQSSASFI